MPSRAGQETGEPPMGYDNITLERRDGIAKITRNRPGKLNALRQKLLDDQRPPRAVGGVLRRHRAA